MSDAVTPLWKKALEKGREPGVRARATSLRLSILNTFDRLGAEAYLHQLATGTTAEKQIFGQLLKACLPLELHGTLDHSLTVKIVTQVGATESVELPAYRHPKDAGSGRLPSPTTAGGARVPEDATSDA